jgi:hypothetical protein
VEHKLNAEQEEMVEKRVKEAFEYADSKINDVQDYAEAAIDALERKVIYTAVGAGILGFLTGLIVGHITKETDYD